jgi:formylglycine-generating enzyme required for sulfatase activity
MGKKYRLPTEAEWEYAARAGTYTITYNGSPKKEEKYNSPILNEIAWNYSNSGIEYEGGIDCSFWNSARTINSNRCGTHPVGQKKPNQFGLFDILGNVYEYTNDWHTGSYVYHEGISQNPKGSENGFSKVIRGGGFRQTVEEVQSAYRGGVPVNMRFNYLGFRLAHSK